MQFPLLHKLELGGIPELIVGLAGFELSRGVAILASRKGGREGGREGREGERVRKDKLVTQWTK